MPTLIVFLPDLAVPRTASLPAPGNLTEKVGAAGFRRDRLFRNRELVADDHGAATATAATAIAFGSAVGGDGSAGARLVPSDRGNRSPRDRQQRCGDRCVVRGEQLGLAGFADDAFLVILDGTGFPFLFGRVAEHRRVVVEHERVGQGADPEARGRVHATGFRPVPEAVARGVLEYPRREAVSALLGRVACRRRLEAVGFVEGRLGEPFAFRFLRRPNRNGSVLDLGPVGGRRDRGEGCVNGEGGARVACSRDVGVADRAVGGDQFFDQFAVAVFTTRGEEIFAVGFGAGPGRFARAVGPFANRSIGPLAVSVRSRLERRGPATAWIDRAQVVLEPERRAGFIEADDADDRFFTGSALSREFGERFAPFLVFLARHFSRI